MRARDHAEPTTPRRGVYVDARSTGWSIPSLSALGLGVVFLSAAAILFALQFTGFFDTLAFSTPDTGTAFNLSSIVETGTPLSAPTETAPGGPPIARLIIPSIGVDAKVLVKGVGADGVMEVPNNGFDVAWYDFSSRPGAGGNSVFSGHVDFRGLGPAVFWDLGKLRKDDLMDVRLEDGSTFTYKVTGKGSFAAETAPVAQIIGRTPAESVTLITCTGVFNPATHQYSERLVVRGERVDAPAPAPGAPPPS